MGLEYFKKQHLKGKFKKKKQHEQKTPTKVLREFHGFLLFFEKTSSFAIERNDPMALIVITRMTTYIFIGDRVSRSLNRRICHDWILHFHHSGKIGDDKIIGWTTFPRVEGFPLTIQLKK